MLFRSTAAATPTITLNPSTLSGFLYDVGSGPSTSQSFTVAATSLNSPAAQVTIDATSTDYELSADNSTFGNTLTITAVSSAITATTRYVRLRSGRAAGSYNNQSISISGGGATASLTVSGSVLVVSSVEIFEPISILG